MLIRKPVNVVYEALVNPEITSKFWFTHGSANLISDTQVEWSWEMYNLTVPVSVKQMIPNQSIVLEWGTDEHISTIKWNFKSLSDSKTFVQVTNYNFRGSKDEIIEKVIDSTGGFTIVLAGLKAWLEYGIQLNLIGDKFPKELMNP